MPRKKGSKSQKADQSQTRTDDVKNALRVVMQRLTAVESGAKVVDGYVDVKKEKSDPLKDVKTTDIPTHPDLRKIFMGGRIKPKLNNLRTRLVVGSSVAGTSGTNVTTVINVRPSAYTEFASFQALFDEFKVHGGVLHFSVWTLGAGNANLVAQDDGAIAYDPVDNSVYASVAGVLVASQHIGPFTVTGATDASNSTAAQVRSVAPLATSKHGFWAFPFKCPTQPQFVANNSQQVMTGEWCATNISNTQGDYGYLKPYIAGAGSTTTTVQYYLSLDVEFRART